MTETRTDRQMYRTSNKHTAKQILEAAIGMGINGFLAAMFLHRQNG